MKEEAPRKKMPRKPSNGGAAPNTPSKVGSDEILSTLLRVNNLDSSTKDESLDIDLSACVTINADSVCGMMNGGNSLSYTDFWRVLDESAQNAQLDMTTTLDDGEIATTDLDSSDENRHSMKEGQSEGTNVRQEQANNFSAFLRPEIPAPSFSPLKKNPKALPAEQQLFKVKNSYQKKAKVKEECPEISHFPMGRLDAALASGTRNPIVVNGSMGHTEGDDKALNLLDPPSFNLFVLPTVNGGTGAPKDAVKPAKNEVPPESKSLVVVSSAPEVVYKCLDCDGMLLRSQQELSIHEAASHRIHYRCGVCEREFEQEAGLKKHLKTHRSVEARKDAWKKCPDCGKCLKLGSMWMHRKIHSDNKKYGCDICGQKFVQKINLTHHSRVHTAEKPYECPECQKRFQERSHLQRHQKYHAQTRSYRCEKCGKMYKTERCLKVHNLVHLEQRPFACNVCDKSFISNSKLKQHSNIHTGERPFKCNYCPRDFTNFPNWLKHTRRRHKVDHKTGEHLENIPSYCSKKSSKAAAKVSKTTEPNSSTNATNEVEKTGQQPAADLPAAKPATKRKKKISPTVDVIANKTDDPALLGEAGTQALSGQQGVLTSAPTSTNTTLVTTIGKCASSKAKRERKQLSPKQVQKPPRLVSPSTHIKKELPEPKSAPITTVETKPTIKNFPDLSITSAEELIMEQALEMEECGLYITPPVVTASDTDNAISAETAAALQFKIKNEYATIDSIKEEFVTVKDVNNRLLCSSLESSPFSSPASVELSSSAVCLPSNLLSAADLQHPAATNTSSSNSVASTTTTTTFYMPFSINSQGSIVTNLNANSIVNHHQSVAISGNGNSPLVQQILPTTSSADLTQQSNNANANTVPTTTQALINHLYLHPMTVSMPLLVQPNQVLPSVDTLLFASHANSGNLFHSKNMAQTPAQHKLS